MNSFRTARLAELAIPQRLVTSLTDIGASRGRQALYGKQTPQVLKALREMAMIVRVSVQAERQDQSNVNAKIGPS